MITQIYTMHSAEEALACVAAGVDHVGLTPPQGLPGQLPLSELRAIVEAVGDRATTVALTVDIDPEVVRELVETVRPDVLHLCPLADRIRPEDVTALRGVLPYGLPILQAISVTGPESVAEARAYAEVADMLILDTQDPEIAGIGASGTTHDWAVSRAIVQAVRVPVILAGGLSPSNVADAIRAVQPWGVDSATHTNDASAPDGQRKDLTTVRAFVAAARAAAAVVQ